MARIQVLDDRLINRIAAGEVVERPSSVVKELVENSIDAGAERIGVELETGGRTLIRVIDDGCGMDADDALLALERHATSKISNASDLDCISSLGFRGEALPSIAAVSRFALHTSVDPAEGGVRVQVEGGRIVDVSGVARARGTTIEIRDLFFNVPARRKFLRAPETELRHCQEAVLEAALSRPGVGFVFRHGPRVLFEVVPTDDLGRRFADLVRRRGDPTVYQGSATMGGSHARVWLARVGSGVRYILHLLVNGRPVRDRLLVGTALRGLRTAGPSLRGARVLVELEMPADAVDVNVHPAKTEVRFARAGGVVAALERALRAAVESTHDSIDVRHLEQPIGPGRVGETPAQSYGGQGSAPRLFDTPPMAWTRSAWDLGERAFRSTGRASRRPGPEPTRRSGASSASTGSFLLVEDEHGLVVVDQHNAHERVIFDRVQRRLAGETAPSQGLLEPVLVGADEAVVAALPKVAELLLQAGIDAEAFGSDTVRIRSLPPELEPEAAVELVHELLERVVNLDGDPATVVERIGHDLAASLACRAAIKINHPLTVAEQRALLGDLVHCDDPYRCPHGRPIVLRLSQEEMERRLGRR